MSRASDGDRVPPKRDWYLPIPNPEGADKQELDDLFLAAVLKAAKARGLDLQVLRAPADDAAPSGTYRRPLPSLTGRDRELRRPRSTPPDPTGFATAAALNDGLRRLRAWAGNPTLREIEQRAAALGFSLSKSTANRMLAPTAVGVPSEDRLVAFVLACAATEQECRTWIAARNRLDSPDGHPGGVDPHARLAVYQPRQNMPMPYKPQATHTLVRSVAATEYITNGARTRVIVSTEADTGYVRTKRVLANEWATMETALEWMVSTREISMLLHYSYTIGELHMAVTGRASFARGAVLLDLPGSDAMREMPLMKEYGSPTASPSELKPLHALANRFTRAETLESFRRALKGFPKSMMASGEWNRVMIRMTEGGYKIIVQHTLPILLDQNMDVTGEVLILGVALDECEGISGDVL